MSCSGSATKRSPELQATVEGQFTLAEVLMVDSVDRLITKRPRCACIAAGGILLHPARRAA
jgi:hypothetical protein